LATQPGETKPTIVLVHGAWADASSFAEVIRALQDRGFRAIGFATRFADSLTTRRTWPTSCGA
jgi:alpha-beta hydrolase superfamily lysophospholipase